MQSPLPKQTQHLWLALSLFVIATLACQPSNQPGPVQPTPVPPPPKFNFAVTVRDRDSNNLIGQATVLLSVGNETVAQSVTDDNGQANFSVAGSYVGKTARLYAKSPYYHPADLEISLTDDSRKILQLISKKNPKIDPDPVEPPPPSNTRVPTPTPTKKPTPSFETLNVGENKSGMIADEQVIDYRFEANENAPLLFNARAGGEQYVKFLVEIYDSQGFSLDKRTRVGVNDPRQLPFTPPKTGSYILRLRGTDNFGSYSVYMEELK